MAELQRIDLKNGSVNLLDANCFFAPYVTINSGSLWNPMVLVMKAAVVSTLKGVIVIPAFTGTPQVEIIWTSLTTADPVDFDMRHRSVGPSGLFDTNTSPNPITDAMDSAAGPIPSAASKPVVTTTNLTTTDLVKGLSWLYEFSRDGVTDDKADNITIWHLSFLYTPE